MAEQGKIRVVQWATGNVGSRALLRIIEHPRLELVGLLVHSEDKAGKDAGELCGHGPVGVKATTRIEDVLALKPDCVSYMPAYAVTDDVVRLLEAGINIVSTRDEFANPKTMDAETRERIEAACAKSGASIHCIGSSPGFITEAMPIVLTSIARRLDCMTIDEFADVSSRDSAQMLFEIMGFGKPMEAFANSEAFAGHLKHAFQPSLHITADALNLSFDDVVATAEFAPATEDIPMAAGTIPKGTMAAQRIVIAGQRNGKTVLQWRANWYCSSKVEADWDFRGSGWRILVEGDTPLDVSITYPVTPEEYPHFTPNLTAHRPINVIPYLVKAEPGFRTTADLPQIIADLGD